MKISVIIPVYNSREYLDSCLLSLIRQTERDFEIILVDDGSTDGSLALEKEYSARYPFIRVIGQEHACQGAARNRGLSEAKGEYIYFMDADDLAEPDLLERTGAVCDERGLDFVMFDSEGFRNPSDPPFEAPEDIFDRKSLGIEDRIYSGPEFWSSFYNDHGVLYVCWLLVIRRSFLLENELFFAEGVHYEDNDWMLRMFLAAKRICYLPLVLHRHLWRYGSASIGRFTKELLLGCLRTHRISLALRHDVEGWVPKRMCEDVMLMNLRHLGALSKGDPFREATEEFCRFLKGELLKEDLPDYDRLSHLAAASCVLDAAKERGDAAFIGRHKDLLSVSCMFGLPDDAAEKTVCIYGTGDVGRWFADLLLAYCDERPGNLCFLDSRKDGGTFCGWPLYRADKIPRLSPDVIVIASSKYREEMLLTIQDTGYTGARIIAAPEKFRFIPE